MTTDWIFLAMSQDENDNMFRVSEIVSILVIHLVWHDSLADGCARRLSFGRSRAAVYSGCAFEPKRFSPPTIGGPCYDIRILYLCLGQPLYFCLEEHVPQPLNRKKLPNIDHCFGGIRSNHHVLWHLGHGVSPPGRTAFSFSQGYCRLLD